MFEIGVVCLILGVLGLVIKSAVRSGQKDRRR